VGSATLTAVTVTVADEGTANGAEYRPLELILPTVEFPPAIPFTRHVTAVLPVFVTVAVNCLVREIRTVALVGEMLMLTGVGLGGFVIVTRELPTAALTALLVA